MNLAGVSSYRSTSRMNFLPRGAEEQLRSEHQVVLKKISMPQKQLFDWLLVEHCVDKMVLSIIHNSPRVMDKLLIRSFVINQLLVSQATYQSITDKRIGLPIIDSWWNLELDKWSPPNPHRVETYSPHLPDTYNSRTAKLGSWRTRKLKNKSLKKRNETEKNSFSCEFWACVCHCVCACVCVCVCGVLCVSAYTHVSRFIYMSRVGGDRNIERGIANILQQLPQSKGILTVVFRSNMLNYTRKKKSMSSWRNVFGQFC
jgi:hypothetical protein